MTSLLVPAQLAVNGVAVGSIYALVALGLVLTYKATEVLNFAHGDLLMSAAFIGLGTDGGRSGCRSGRGARSRSRSSRRSATLIDAAVMRRIVGQPQFAGVMLTIAHRLHAARRGQHGLRAASRASYATPWTGQTTAFGGVVVADLNLVILGDGAAGHARRCSLSCAARGSAWRSRRPRRTSSRLICVACAVKRINSLVWAIAGALAALCGVLLAPMALVDISLWFVVLKAMAALVLGGFGSIAGAIVGGLLIGLVEQFAGVYVPDGIKDIVAYVVLIVVLVVWPRGLLGEAHGRRV